VKWVLKYFVLLLSCGTMPHHAISSSIGIDPTNRFAWGENVGWINAAPNGGGVTVHFDGISGYLSGFAWGENIGWVKMGDDNGGPYQNDSATNWGVNVETGGGLSGFAWSENAGWISFSSSVHQVVIDFADGRFDGYAWGEGIGWIRFNGPASNYNVRTLAFDTQTMGTPNWWLNNEGVSEMDDEGDFVPAWQEYVADTDPANAESFLYIAAISNKPQPSAAFPSSATRYYTLQRQDNAPSGTWADVAGQIGIQGSSGTMSLPDAAGSTAALYRVKVTVTP